MARLISLPKRPFLPDFTLKVCGDAWWKLVADLTFSLDVLERLGLLGLEERRLGRDLQANRSPNGWSAMSEDLYARGLLWSTSESWTIRRFDWRQVQRKSQAWLVGEMGTNEIWFSLAGRNDNTQRQKTKYLWHKLELYYNCLLVEIWIWNAWALLGFTFRTTMKTREKRLKAGNIMKRWR